MAIIDPHQLKFAKTARPYEGLWHGTGCAKTRTALYTVREYSGSILVVAPKTTVHKKQWQYEAKVLGIKEPRVISKEEFRRDHRELERYDVFIFDEAHHGFGVSPNTHTVNKQKVPKSSQIYDAVKWYIETHRPARFIPATATPNKTPMSIYAAATLLGHEVDFFEFRKQFYVVLPMDLPFGQVAYAPKRTEKAMKELADFTRSIGQVLRLEDLKDIVAIPPKIESFDLTADQKKAIKMLSSRFTGDASLRVKRHQIENGILYGKAYNPDTRRVEDISERYKCDKIEYIVDRADEFKKMIIFANYTEQVNAIADALREAGKNVLVMDSSTKDRKAVEMQAEAADSAYIVAQASVSSEWEFKTCSVVIFASLSNRAIDYIQGKGRPQRYDSIKSVLYIHLKTEYEGSIDSKWFDVIMSGRDFNEALYE